MLLLWTHWHMNPHIESKFQPLIRIPRTWSIFPYLSYCYYSDAPICADNTFARVCLDPNFDTKNLSPLSMTVTSFDVRVKDDRIDFERIGCCREESASRAPPLILTAKPEG